MLDEMESAPVVVRPSAYWELLNARNFDQLAGAGFEEFKRTVNRNYFNWVPTSPLDEQFRAVARAWLRRPVRAVGRARLADTEGLDFLPGQARRATHALFLALLWEAVRRRDHRGMLERLEEPALGAPITVHHRGRSISQDLCNSVHEVTSILDGLPGGSPGGTGVLELGGGYGRIAWVLLHELPEVRYVLCDIPPALAIAQRYLTTVFPQRRAFRFRHFDRPEEVADELAAAQIAFLTPNQLDLLPAQDVGLFVNVSSLHEMRPEQIAHYLRAVDRHCCGFFYTKQWKRSVNPFDGIEVRREDYPIPPHWQTIFDRDHEIQVSFFEALYRVR
jgi:putative sugar O-methyltransferase